MQVAFYKARGTWLDRLVRWWTKGRYSHCAIVLPGNVWWEASGSTRSVRTLVQEIDPQEWDIIDVPMTTDELNSMRRFCDEERGCFYDYIGVALTQVIPLSFENPWWWFCSEFVTACMQQAGRLAHETPHEMTPDDVFILLREDAA